MKEEPAEPSCAAPLPPAIANAGPSHRQGGPRNQLVLCGLRRWSSQPAGEPKPHRLVILFLKISPFTPNTTPIKETEGSRIQSVHDFPKSPIRFRTTLSNPRN